MKKIIVTPQHQPSKSYEIVIGEHLLEGVSEYIDFSKYSKIAIITDQNVSTHLEKLLKNFKNVPLAIELSSGEQNKNIENVQKIWQQLTEYKFDRKSLILNLGGGMITDIGGFAASTYMRGIDFVNIPTTLLSQVDASVGGKTGINFSGIKNIIGTFNQPKLVLIDILTLQTLPDREFNSGFAEIIKHGLICDKNYFEFVTSKKPREFSTAELIEIISKSCELKKRITENDPKELGERKILNFGHTIGHAVEAISIETNKILLHGEAISIGMVAEANISQIKNLISIEDLELIKLKLLNADLPIAVPDFETKKIIEKIRLDKKNNNANTNFTLLKNIGEAVYDQTIAVEIITKVCNS